MKYVFLLALVALASASVIPDRKIIEDHEIEIKRIDQDELVKKHTELLNKLVDKIVDLLQNGKYFAIFNPELVLEMIGHIKTLRDNHINWVNIINNKVKGLKENIRTRIEEFVHYVKKIFNFDDEPVHEYGVQRNQDELVKTHIENLNKLFDKIIDLIENGKTFSIFHPDVIMEMISHMKTLRDNHIDWINIVHEKVKNIRGGIRDKIMEFINYLKKIFNFDDEPVHEYSVKRNQDELVKKHTELLNKLVDKIIDLLQNGKYFSIFNPDLVLEMIDHIKTLRDNHINWVNIINNKVKGLKENIRTRIEEFVHYVKRIFNFDDEPVHEYGVQRNQDELVKNHIELLNKLFDKIIDLIENGKTFSIFHPDVIMEMISHMKTLRDNHVNWINIVNEKVKNIRGGIRERIMEWVNYLKKIFNFDDEPVHEAPVVDNLLKQKEELKQKFLQKIDDIIENFRAKNLPGTDNTIELMKIIREGIRLGMDMDTLVMERVRLMGGHVKMFLEKMISFVFGWTL